MAQSPLTSICCGFVVQHAVQEAVRQIESLYTASQQHVVTTRVHIESKSCNDYIASYSEKMSCD